MIPADALKPFGRWSLGLHSFCASVMLCVIVFGGCFNPAPKKQDVTPQVSSKDRPPLQIWLLDAPELENEISIRWQTASDQPAQIKNVSIADLTTPPFQVDVIIFPGAWMGDLVRDGVIGKLPSQVLKGESQASDPVATWPTRWRSIASYGGQWYGIPLGAAPLGAIARQVDVQGLVSVESALKASQLDTATALAGWDKLLSSAEKGLGGAANASAAALDKLSKLGEREKSYMVDRFLWIASTSDARRKGLFDLVKMQSRIHQIEFVESARVLARMARLSADAVGMEPTQAWTLIASAEKDVPMFAIGRPGSSLELTSKPEVSDAQVVPLLWGTEHGLVASVGKNTRQTSVSCQFLSWLAAEEQRESLRPVCSRIELLPTQADRGATLATYREFVGLASRAHLQQSMDLSLRFANGSKYRSLLADALIQVIQNPEKAQSIMTQCSSDWNQLTEKLDKDKQRLSIEQSLGFQK
jgi:hypothetical protein